ncbi:MAG: mechanosensitive ion channel domain-containing protein [Gammaproteobacteria bacterium]
MELISKLLDGARLFLPVLVTLAIVIAGLSLVNWFLTRRWRDQPDAQFRFQMIMLALTFAGILAVIIAFPISDTLRGQLLSLIGILLSAAIALSSTTFIGNIMAGIMLRAIKSARPGDFITVADITGRITRMELLHTEVQTEDRNLATLPNLFMVTQPMRVVRANGTIISAEVSLGYDVSRSRVTELLCEAAGNAGLTDAFVLVRELGDYSVLYRVAGLLEEAKGLISARSRLRASMLDALHGAGVEVVSPNFMNTRTLGENTVFIPRPSRTKEPDDAVTAEAIAFDKAEEAASVEAIRKAIEILDLESSRPDEAPGEAAQARKTELDSRKAELLEQLKQAEEQRKASDHAERTGTKSA